MGYYCAAGTTFPYPCPIGTYNPSEGQYDSDHCLECPAGQACVSIGQSSAGPACEPGYYCPDKSQSTYQEECQAGTYCVGGNVAEVDCADGTYQPNNVQSSCMTCPEGFYCPGLGNTIPTICPAGYYCPTAMGDDLTSRKCPIGTFSDREGLVEITQCQDCGYGKYCTAEAQVSSEMGNRCEETYFCQPGTGTHGDVAHEHMTQDRMEDNLCGAGQGCGSGTIVPEECEPGYYWTNASPLSTPQCAQCAEDRYCPYWGTEATLEEDDADCYNPDSNAGGSKHCQMKCWDGYHCKGNAVHPNVRDDITVSFCAAGYTCQVETGQDTIKGCEPGWYQDMVGQITCKSCPAGFTCPETATTEPLPCEIGKYCPLWDPNVVGGEEYSCIYVESTASGDVTHDNCMTDCPAGTYNNVDYAAAPADCKPCPPGKYCEVGEIQYTGFCDEGFVCVEGSDTATPVGVFGFADYADTNNGACPTGHYCPRGSSHPIPCAAGSYQDEIGGTDASTGLSVCKACPAYKYCGQDKLDAPTGVCADGYVCFGSSVYAQPFDYSMGRLCDAGNYCTSGMETQCTGGSFAPVDGMSSCTTCPPGYYCNASTGTITPIVCPTYHYCPVGSEEPTSCDPGTYTESHMKGLEAALQCAPCPTGYYCPEGSYESSNKCDAGYYCHSGASIANDSDNICPGGYYCPEGASVPTHCADGLYSFPGAKSASDCVECYAGYYCVREVNIANMWECPPGHYCELGNEEPKQCPKGHYNFWPKGEDIDACEKCPRGTNCDVTGIALHENHQCPPGYFCEEGAYSPRACPAGAFRPQQGGYEMGPIPYPRGATGRIPASCYYCIGGFFCESRGTRIPAVCKGGTYCPEGSISEEPCPPGSYCPAMAVEPIICPPGYWCMGRSAEYRKCESGFYCPEGSAEPTPCPSGYYGSGNSDNFDVASGCQACGRGLYSEEATPNACPDCTPGYVCLGATSSKRPFDREEQNGYMCPLGFYCPSGTYQERPCPPGTMGKYEGTESLAECLPCKVNTYNDLWGQGGCKRCGPTSSSEGYLATTCECVGKYRVFIKTSGSCLCKRGYRPVSARDNVDSLEDCEADIKPPCPFGQDVDGEGNCMTPEIETSICERQCVDGRGTFVQGTGLCACDQINDVSSVCNASCQSTIPTVRLSRDGMLTVDSPTQRGPSRPLDPSSIPGYYGNFRCTPREGATDCQTFTMGMAETGDFTFDYGTNPDLLDATDTPDNVDRGSNSLFTSFHKRWRNLDGTYKGRSERLLQSSTSQRLYNPVICIKEGDIVFFNVDGMQYPRYWKDSILNTNENFDSAPFTDLESMIVTKGIDVQTFSYNFRERGIYVFENAASGTVTIVGVVAPSQECQNVVNGVGASMVTEEALSEIGIQSQSLNVTPRWWFLCWSYGFMNVFLFGVIALINYAYQLNVKRAEVASSSRDAENTIYYDKVSQLEQDEKDKIKTLCSCRRKKKTDTKVEPEDDAPKIGYAISYPELEDLMDQFKAAQTVLRRQLKDKEKRALLREIMEAKDQGLPIPVTDEQHLIDKYEDLLSFVKQNRETVSYVVDADKERERADASATHADEDEDDGSGIQRSRTSRGVKTMLKKQELTEAQYQAKQSEDIRRQQELAFNSTQDKNDEQKNALLGEYKNRLSNSNLSADERAAILAEMEGKMSMINDMVDNEKKSQDAALQEALARRRAKKEKLKGVMNNLAAQKDAGVEHVGSKLAEVKRQEQADAAKLDKELDQVKKQEQRDIEQRLQREKRERLGKMEDRLAAMRKRQQSGENDDKLADMLNEYGELVKRVDEDLKSQREDEMNSLEARLLQRRRDRRQQISEKAKSIEEGLNKEGVEDRSDLQDRLAQVESLLQPVKQEEERLARITNDIKITNAIGNKFLQKQITLSKESQEAQKQLNELDKDKSVDKIVQQIEKENQVKKVDVENTRNLLRKNIEGTMDEDERKRLMKQLNEFESNLKSTMQNETDVQNAKLQSALEARRNKKKALRDKIAAEKNDKIKESYKNSTNKVNADVDVDGQNELAQRLVMGFDKNEVVQVSENYLDQKTQQELVDLMNALFEERSKSLRNLISELMSQKSRDLEDLSAEYEPQKELLRSKRSKNLTSEQEFVAGLDRLTNEMSEKKMDIEIEYSEKEKQLKEDLEQIKLEAEAEQKKILKDRQTQEKMLMFQKLMDNAGEQNDSVKEYLQKQMSDSEKELESFKRKADREKIKRVEEIESTKQAESEALMQRQARMFNWEDKMKKQEERFMEQFQRQKEGIKAKKLAEQQKELLKDMNQKDVDAMMQRHRRELAAIDSALAEEQKRQMANMQEQMKNRNAKLATTKAIRQIKLAEIQKQKQEQAIAARKYAAQVEAEANKPNAAQARDAKIKHCVEKADLLQRLISKQCYSRPLLVRKHVNNIRKLNDFYGLDYRQDWGDDVGSGDEGSVLTVESAELMKLINQTKVVTYKNLVERVDHTQENYDNIRDKKGLRQKLEKKVRDRDNASQAGLNIFDDNESQM